ncbi:MAG TPA: hypothetical protein VF648_13720 [Pyrinomonadaceae bacterium]
MKRTITLLITCLICIISVFAQEEPDKDFDGLKGSVRTVENYQTDYIENKGKYIKGERRLTSIVKYNQAGNWLELISPVYEEDKSYFNREVRAYDSDGKLISIEYYSSAKSKLNRMFSIKESNNGFERFVSKSDEKFIRRTFIKYNDKGKELEQVTFDADGSIYERSIYSYNEDGKESRFSAYAPDGKPGLEYLKTYKGRIEENIRYQSGIADYKIIYTYDEKGRIKQEEQFDLKLTSEGAIKEEVIRSKSFNTYEGEFEKLEWFLFDSNGSPTTKLFIVHKNDIEISREELLYVPAPTDNISPQNKAEWRFRLKETAECEYDEKGSWVKCVFYKQGKSDEKPIPQRVEERVITYY